MLEIDQKNAAHQVTIAGADDVFHMVSAHFVEEIDDDFTITVDTSAKDPNVDIKALIGKALSVKIGYEPKHGELPYYPSVNPEQLAERHIEGIIVEIKRGDVIERALDLQSDDPAEMLYEFQFIAKPMLELSKFRVQSKAFTEMGPIAIAKSVIGDHTSMTVSTEGVSEADEPAPHTLEYQENDYKFIQRMLQKDGASYYFTHGDGYHKMEVFTEVPKSSTTEIDCSILADFEPIFREFKWQTSLAIETFSMHDWDVGKHTHMPTSDSQITDPIAHPGSVSNIYPSGASAPSSRLPIAKRRAIANTMKSLEINADLAAPSVCVGEIYKFNQHPDERINNEYIVTRIEFALSNENPRGFLGKANLVAKSNGVAPQPTMVRPEIHGLLTAVVVKPSEEDTLNDPDGRIGRVRVKYTFDNQTESFWARVSQAWAGPDYGAWFTPRVGHEVLIGFLHDDPDLPVVLGSMVNGKNKLIYQGELGDQVSYIRTKSEEGYNELFFRDKGDEELIRTKAHLDMVTEVGRHHSIHVMEDYSISAGKELKRKPAMGAGKPADGSKGNMNYFAEKDIVIEAGENKKVTIGKDTNVETGKNTEIKSGENIPIDAGKNMTFFAFDQVVSD